MDRIKKLEEDRKIVTERIYVRNTRCKDKKKGESAEKMITGIRNTLKVKDIEKEKRDILSIVL